MKIVLYDVGRTKFCLMPYSDTINTYVIGRYSDINLKYPGHYNFDFIYLGENLDLKFRGRPKIKKQYQQMILKANKYITLL